MGPIICGKWWRYLTSLCIININSLCAQNHQELYSQRAHTSKGQNVLQWKAGWFEQQYFTEQYIILTRTEEGHEKD